MDYNSLTDEELCNMAQQNDAEAMQVLIERYKSTVASISRAYFLSGGDVEDLIQEGMISVFKAIETFNGNVEFKFYAYKCIKNAIFSAIKRYKSIKNTPLDNYISLSGINDNDVDKSVFFANDEFSPEETLINKEAVSELKNKLFSVLTKQQKEVLTLYLQGFSYKQIAEKVNKNVKWVDNTIQRIKKKLSATLSVAE